MGAVRARECKATVVHTSFCNGSDARSLSVRSPRARTQDCMMKNLPTGTASSVSDFNERTRALFKDKPEFTRKPSERKNKNRWSTKPKEDVEPSGTESEAEPADNEAEMDRDETNREEDDKATDD